MSDMEIRNKFKNSSNCYYGHGIGAYDEKKMKSIFDNGLRCSHEQLYFTTIALGLGSENLFDENSDLLNNWEHKDSRQIIIASVPIKYNLLDITGTDLYGMGQAAFYNEISQDEAQKLNIAPGYYLRPEFVLGMYDADKKEFVSNDNYYENLKQSEQDLLFYEIKNRYIKIIKEAGYSLKEYGEILDSINWENPLTSEEILQIDSDNIKQDKITETEKLNVEQQSIATPKTWTDEVPIYDKRGNIVIQDYINPELIKGKVTLPNGTRINATQYIQEVVVPLIPKSGKFKLKNGIEIPAKQYIEEFFLGVGQTKYNGDINALLQDTLVETDDPPKGSGWATMTNEQTMIGSKRQDENKSRSRIFYESLHSSNDISEKSKESKRRGFRETVQSTNRIEPESREKQIKRSKLFLESLRKSNITSSEVKHVAGEIEEIQRQKALSFKKSASILTPAEEILLETLNKKYGAIEKDNKKKSHDNKKQNGISM